MNGKVLIVEDEDSIRRFITINLKRSGFTIFEAATGEAALESIEDFMPDLVILDIMLPGIDGFEICNRIKSAYPSIAVIMLSARGLDMDKIVGLNQGADDYIVKPFNPLELIARAKAVLRRFNKEITNSEVYIAGNFRVDEKTQIIFKEDMALDLTPREYQLLKIFIKNPGVAFNRDELIDRVWGQDYIGHYKTIDVHIRRLREKIESNPSQPQLIETIWGYGYRWRGGESK